MLSWVLFGGFGVKVLVMFIVVVIVLDCGDRVFCGGFGLGFLVCVFVSVVCVMGVFGDV